MMDDIEITDQAKEAVALALASAGPPDERGWKTRVQRAVPFYAALVRDDYGWWGKEAQGIVDADVFTCQYLGHRLEESSQRLIVKVQALRGDSEPEEMRTERTDTPPGRVMKDRLEHLEPGTEIALFKKIEQMAGSRDRKVRVLVHFETLRSHKSTQGASPGTASSSAPMRNEDAGAALSGGDAGGSESSPPSGEPPQASGETTAVLAAIADLSNRQKIAVRNACVGQGIENWTDPGPDLERVMAIIQEVAS